MRQISASIVFATNTIATVCACHDQLCERFNQLLMNEVVRQRFFLSIENREFAFCSFCFFPFLSTICLSLFLFCFVDRLFAFCAFIFSLLFRIAFVFINISALIARLKVAERRRLRRVLTRVRYACVHIIGSKCLSEYKTDKTTTTIVFNWVRRSQN